MKTSDNVCISSAQSPTKSISVTEYLTYLDDLEKFYNKSQNYFPLANIYIAKKQYKEAFSAILYGIKFSINLRNFRLVYYYCKLMQMTPTLSDHMLSYAYNYILKNTNTTEWRLQDHYNYGHYIDSIRNTLMNERHTCSLQVSINTNITCVENDKLAVVIAVIDDIVGFTKKTSKSDIKYYVEVRHNSPFEMFIKFFGITGSLLEVLGILYFALWGSNYLIEKIQKHYSNYLDNKIKGMQFEKEKASSLYFTEIADLEIEEKRQMVREKKISNDIKENELRNQINGVGRISIQDKGLEMHRKLNLHKIIIVNGGHTFFDNSGDIFDNDIIHYYRE